LVRRDRLHGKDIIVLEDLPNAIVWIEESDLKKLLSSIKADVKDIMGYAKYRDGLRSLGYDV